MHRKLWFFICLVEALASHSHSSLMTDEINGGFGTSTM